MGSTSVIDEVSEDYETIKVTVEIGGTTYIHKQHFSPVALERMNVKNAKKEVLITLLDVVIKKLEKAGALV